MVKSNKFDYGGRSSSGSKLGKSIAADLEKRAEKKQKESLKATTKSSLRTNAASKRSSKKELDKSRDDNADGDDQDASKHDVHKLDLKVPGKALGDEGFALLCDGLEKALISCQDLALVEFNATDNKLTTRSLARLAPIIHHSRFNLQSLDLSHNDFQVTDAATAKDWECFLVAFHDCMTLRRIDLSGNSALGSWAFEILARVYSREPPVDPLSATGAQSVITLPDEEAFDTDAGLRDDEEYDTMDDDAGDYLPRSANGKTLADTQDLGYRRGLRSVPYITLSNVGLTDTGALFLSYVLEQHYFPTQLISETNAVEAGNICSTYRQDGNINGINWDNNSETLGKDGALLLKCADRHRAKQVMDDSDNFAGSSFELVRPQDSQEHNPPSRKSYSSSARRTSGLSLGSAEHSAHDRADITNARKRIQRNTIAKSGCRSVELWHAGLKAVATSRLLFAIAPARDDGPGSWTASSPGPNEEAFDDSSLLDTLHTPDDLETSFYAMSIGADPSREDVKEQNRRSYAATLATTSPLDPEEPVFAVTNVTNLPQRPVVQTGFKSLSATRNSSPSLAKQHFEEGRRFSSSSYAEHNSVSDAEHNFSSNAEHNFISNAKHNYSSNAEHNLISDAEHTFSSDTKHNFSSNAEHNSVSDAEHNFLSDAERSFSSYTKPTKAPYEIDGLIERVNGEPPFLKFQRQRLEELRDEHDGQSDGYRDVSQRCHLPLPVCVKILGHAMNSHDFNILKPQQQRGAAAWGQKRSTLGDELEWRSKDESFQILMVLGKADCVDF